MNKEEILSRIQQITEENGGKTPGYKRFKNITGIGPYEWGKYWANYGEAVKEAGFNPNKLWERVPDEVLMEELITLIRKIERYPTLGEMRVYQSKNVNFPYTIIKKRKKPFVVNGLINYCENKPEYSDIIRICKPLEYDLTDNSDGISNDNSRYGFVYLIKGHPGEYKIGSTDSVNRRIPELDATSSVRYQLIHEIETDDRYGIESYWHKRFKDKLMRREWFRLKPADVNAFKRWRKIF